MHVRAIRLIVLLAFALIAQHGVADDASSATPRFEHADCGFDGVDANWAQLHRVECGWLHVPATRAEANAPTLKVWTAIARADTPSNQPPLLYIHGGPGLGTVDYFFPYFPQSKTWPAFRKDRDLVYFDQRGTGRSDPPFCPELKRTLEALRKQDLTAKASLEKTRAAFAECRGKLVAAGIDPATFNTRATVEDAEDLRRALKFERWSLFGISYGTLVALDYMREHPDAVHAAILDSVYPPNSAHGHEQITATAAAYAALQRACDRQPTCKRRFADIGGQLKVAVQRLDAKPLKMPDGGLVDGARLRGAIWNLLVTSDFVPWVPLAIDRAAAGDARSIRELISLFGGFDSFGDFSPGQALAVNCHDIGVGRKAASVRLAHERFPWLVDADAIAEEDDLLCATWQSASAPMAFLAPVRSDVPTLLYGGEFDPATPFEDAVLAARHLRNATLIDVSGASHAAMGRDACTRSIALAFLATPSAQPDTACLQQREPIEFRTKGLEEFLRSMTSH